MSKILTTRQAQPPAVQQATHDVEMAKATAIAKAGDLLPRTYRSNPGAVLLAMDWADRVGLSVMDAIHGVAWVQGKPVIDATLQRALATRAGYRILVTDASRESVTAKVVLTATGETLGSVTYTIEDARTAGLAGKDNWKKNPEDMLVARATSRAVRRFCSDVLVGGGLTEDEVESLEDDPYVPQEAPTAVVEATDVVDAEVVEEPAEAPQEPAEAPQVPKVPETATKAEEPATAAPELRGEAKGAIAVAKGQGYYSAVAEAMQAADIPLVATRWTGPQAQQVIELVAELRPAEFVITDDEEA